MVCSNRKKICVSTYNKKRSRTIPVGRNQAYSLTIPPPPHLNLLYLCLVMLYPTTARYLNGDHPIFDLVSSTSNDIKQSVNDVMKASNSQKQYGNDDAQRIFAPLVSDIDSLKSVRM